MAQNREVALWLRPSSAHEIDRCWQGLRGEIRNLFVYISIARKLHCWQEIPKRACNRKNPDGGHGTDVSYYAIYTAQVLDT